VELEGMIAQLQEQQEEKEKSVEKLKKKEEASKKQMKQLSSRAHFTSLEQLKLEWNDYVHWFNYIRIHGTLGYLTPIEYKKQAL